ncbi:MAG: ribonuclease H family protein [Dysgonamonadaceae bacterium]|jgi:ribonuclease HI|nr:ribonuclease H family protein [Dysgonamonadaceae bacterium]
MPKPKFYVVWKGKTPGIYTEWKDCRSQIEGFEGAMYKSFPEREEAETAYRSQPVYNSTKRKKAPSQKEKAEIINDSISVDAACSGNPGPMEYRGVCTATGKEIFHIGPLQKGTNNIGEFLAIVHGLAMLKQKGSTIPVYSDSRNAMIWIKNKRCNTKLVECEENKYVFELIKRAERWLNNNDYNNTILKWKTKQWGEIPADFGRK